MKSGHTEDQMKCCHHIFTDVPETNSSMQDKMKDVSQMSVRESSGNTLCIMPTHMQQYGRRQNGVKLMMRGK